MKLKRWELSFGLFEGVLLGYRNYPDVESNKTDHVFYLVHQHFPYQKAGYLFS